MKHLLVPALFALAAPLALAKLPALDDAAKAKAAEAAAKAAWQGKVDAYQLCKVQDRVVAHYRKTAAKPVAAAPAAAPAASAAPAATAAPAAPVATAAPANGAATAVAAAPAGCAEPGPFAYTPPEQKPLESAGAHSPAGNASSPPSVIAPAATIQGPASAAKR